MATVYSQSRETFLWLGDVPDTEADSDVDKASFTSQPGIVGDNLKISRAFELLEQLSAGVDFPTDETRESGEDALHHFLDFSWWNRIWTVQEAVLPKVATFACGPLRMPWSVLIRVVRNMLAQYNASLAATGDPVPTSILMLRLYGKTRAIDLYRRRTRITEVSEDYDRKLRQIGALHRFRDRHASDIRDYIYGMLGLMPDAVAAAITPDYSREHPAIFADTIVRLVSYWGDLGPLWRPREYGRDPNLPSWVPDWTARIMPVDAWQAEISRLRRVSWDSAAGRRATAVSYDPGEGALTLRGRLTGVVMQTSGAFEAHTSWDDVSKCIQNWAACISKAQPYPGSQGGTYEEAFWLTMNGDMPLPNRKHFKRGYKRGLYSFT